ncbi:MAG: O-methyltransferase [Bacteroidales bacterium]|nr:O-methyltransferase [Bacteroidales bacterium]
MEQNELTAEYCSQHSTDEPEILKEITRQTYLSQAYPQMLSGHLQGRLLSMISKMIQPKLAVEIGTFTGYSCLCLAEGLSKDGILHTIEINPELEDRNRKNFTQSSYSSQIKIHTGNAISIIKQLPDHIDLAFIDADKEEYLTYYEALIPKMRSGGLILADNVLWGGKVIKPLTNKDKETEGIIGFNKHLISDQRIEIVMIPIRDGLSIIRKK